MLPNLADKLVQMMATYTYKNEFLGMIYFLHISITVNIFVGVCWSQTETKSVIFLTAIFTSDPKVVILLNN